MAKEARRSATGAQAARADPVDVVEVLSDPPMKTDCEMATAGTAVDA